jgi:hypothetical protein
VTLPGDVAGKGLCRLAKTNECHVDCHNALAN